MASTLEDAVLGAAVRRLAESAARVRTHGLLFAVSAVAGGWSVTALMDGDRPLPHVGPHDTLAEVFLELADLIPDDKENADG